MPDASGVVAWCFHSPRRLAVIVIAALTLVLVAGVAVRHLVPSAQRSTPSSVGVVAGSQGALSAAVDFARVWASKPATVTTDGWHAELQSLTTPELGRLLKETDPTSVPGGGPTGQSTIRFLATQSALVEVPLSSGQPVLVTVILSGGRWVASDVQPLEGDAGDVTPGASASVG